ncbi:hypothetical protein NQ314_017803, partial [Rhamnusium bicolor]
MPDWICSTKKIDVYNVQKERFIIPQKNRCQSCSFGYYNDKLGQTECSSCSLHYSTRKMHSKKADDCKEECPPGTHARKKHMKYSKHHPNITIERTTLRPYCRSCAVGFYQPEYGQLKCLPCPNGYTTTTTRSTNPSQCIPTAEELCKSNKGICNNGTCSISNDYQYTCNCFENYIGYGGDYCEINIKYCTEDICENNGTCVEDENTFRCHCKNSFIGRRCNILPCDYKPCHGHTICININEENATKESYRCICPEGYTGKECTEEINFCENSPCLNGGSCSSNQSSYSCSCSSLYHGHDCQYKRNTKYLLHFQSYDTNDYVRLNGFTDNITEITACLWMQTLDSFNYGTLLSYATRYIDNAFTLTDYTGLVLYINNDYIVTDVLLNDGYWHHVCTMWQSYNGSYKVYIDGKVIKYGTGLSTNTYIQGSGNMIVGQEQDIIGGKFSQSESFVGKMTYIDIWSKFLTDEDVLTHFNDCNDSFFGNLYAWPQMQDFIKGGVQLGNDYFYQDKITYNCYDGLNLVGNSTIICQENGKWFPDKPQCLGIQCTAFKQPSHSEINILAEQSYENFVENDTKFDVGTQIEVKCKQNANISGENIITCLENGTWDFVPPQCILKEEHTQLKPKLDCATEQIPPAPNNAILCVAPPSIMNMALKNEALTKDTYHFGNMLSYKCEDGYSMFGNSVIRCMPNGRWSRMQANCI